MLFIGYHSCDQIALLAYNTWDNFNAAGCSRGTIPNTVFAARDAAALNRFIRPEANCTLPSGVREFSTTRKRF